MDLFIHKEVGVKAIDFSLRSTCKRKQAQTITLHEKGHQSTIQSTVATYFQSTHCGPTLCVHPVQNGMFHCHDGNVNTSEWLTPPDMIEALGHFDLDPCSPVNRPWPTAGHHFTILDDSLLQKWFGRVWLNPPYDKAVIEQWMSRMAHHNNGVALTFGRTDTDSFHKYVFPFADSILFINKRLHFYTVEGKRAKSNGGAPSVLIAYGQANSDAIAESGIRGCHLPVNSIGVVVVEFDKSWQMVIRTALVKLNGEAALQEIYNEVEAAAGEKVAKNKNYRAKIRQVLQKRFPRTGPGVYAKQ